jgi:hypothetical protein
MKRIIISENGLNKINSIISEDSKYDAYIADGKKYLDANYHTSMFDNNGDYVTTYVKMSNGMPTSKVVWRQDVLDALDKHFFKIIKDEKERKGFINQLLSDWETNGFSKYGSLSNYNW